MWIEGFVYCPREVVVVGLLLQVLQRRRICIFQVHDFVGVADIAK